MSDSSARLGGLVMMSKSGGLKPKAVAGKPSVTRLTHNSWTGIKASGMPKAAVRKILKASKKQIKWGMNLG
jgi:ADP-ribosylglycohydrolase